MYDLWEGLQRYILDFNEAWSYKSKSKKMLGSNTFDKVDKISNSHFFLLQDSKNKFFYMEQKVKGNCVDVFKRLKYWKNTES